MITTVYLLIGEDRHTDDAISVYRNVIDAQNGALKFRQFYGTQYTWQKVPIPGWIEYYRTECEDGPTVRIEKRDLL